MEYRLEDICTSLVRGPFGSALKKEYFVDKTEETYRVYEQGNAIRKTSEYGDYHIDKDKFQELKRFEVKPLDFIMSCSGTIGELYQLPREAEKGIINQALLKMTVNSKIVDYDFFKYIFLHNIFQLESKGSGIKNVASIKVLKELRFNIPLLDEQKKIVRLLNNVSHIINGRSNQLIAFDELIKSRFVEMFGDPITNPFGWSQISIKDVCSSIVRGPFGSALKKEFFVEPGEMTYKVYEQKHAIQKSASIGTYYVTAAKYKELKRFECVAGDILMSCSGTMGEIYQLPKGCEKGIINQALCKFTLNDKILPIVFLTYMKQTVQNLETKGSGIQNIAAVSYVKAMPINLPPMDVQIQFSNFVQQVDKLKIEVKKSLDETQLLFDSLMQKYFG